MTLQDLAPERISPAIQRAHALYKKRLKQPHLVQAAFDRLIPDVRGDGVAKADLVIEAIVENAEIKRKLFAGIEPRMKEGAILATNTSSIPLQELSGVLARPERLVGLHFFNPVAQMMLVEIVEGPQTSPEVMQAGQAFARQIDKLPLPCKSAPGFLVNRVLSPYLMEAMLMLDEGVPGETIDAAAKDFGMPMGPIELADMVGLDICWAVGQELAKPGTPIPKRLQANIEAKNLGKKTGKGFYTWVKGKPQKASGSGSVDLKPHRGPAGAPGAQRGGGLPARGDRGRRGPVRRGRDLRHGLRAASRRADLGHQGARQGVVAQDDGGAAREARGPVRAGHRVGFALRVMRAKGVRHG